MGATEADVTEQEDEPGEFTIGIWEYVVGYKQYIILRLIEAKTGITTPEIGQNPNLSSPNGVYSLQKNGLIYSKQTSRAGGKWRGATEWYLTKVGKTHLEKYDKWPKFESWGAVRHYQAQQRNEPPPIEIPMPKPTLELAVECTSSTNGNHNKLPTGTCLWCGKEVA